MGKWLRCQPRVGHSKLCNVWGAVSDANRAQSEELESLESLRARMDSLDQQLARLLQERAEVSLRVGKTKSGGESAPIFVPHREAEVLANVQAVRGPLDEHAMASIYREILSTSRALQRPTRVAHLGPMATFGHQAAEIGRAHV